MILPGLVSITFRKLSPGGIVQLAAQAGLAGIEWGGDIHVPHGDLARAREVRSLTESHGLQIPAYGSYYRAGESEAAGLSFKAVLDTAHELGAPLIRVWAGKRGSAEAEASYREQVTADLRRTVEMAAERGIALALEFHGGTLADRAPETMALCERVGHPGLVTYWQPRVLETVETGLGEIDLLAPRLSHLHVFHWPEHGVRAPLLEGAEGWKRYFGAARALPGDRFAMLEFVRDDAPEALLEDAAALKQLVAG